MAIEYTKGTNVVNNDLGQFQLDGLVDLTISCWIKVDETPDATLRGLVNWFNGASLASSGYNFMAKDSKVHFYIRDTFGRTGTWRIISALNNVVVGEWHSYVGRFYDDVPNSTFQMDFWIDGVYQGNYNAADDTPTPLYQSDCSIFVGNNASNKILCTVSDLAIWNTNLTDDQCVQLGTFPKSGVPLMMKPDNLLGYWRMDEYNDGMDVLQGLIAGTWNKWQNYVLSNSLSVFTISGSGTCYQRARPFP